jgi:hypothetical protein
MVISDFTENNINDIAENLTDISNSLREINNSLKVLNYYLKKIFPEQLIEKVEEEDEV